MAAIALDEIDFRDLLGRIAESRFQRIAMSLGDGLVCTDSNHLITVWNPGAAAIFGYRPCGNDRPAVRSDLRRATPRPRRLDFDLRGSARQIAAAGRLVMEFDGRRKNGEVFPVEACFSGWQGTDGFQYGAILRDISVRKREAERIRYLAEYDSLTGLANRNTLHAGLTAMIPRAEADRREVALLVVGLDGFQQINDMLGHACGDLVLRAVSERLTAEIRRRGMVARLSGDEFAIAVPGADMSETVAQFCRTDRARASTRRCWPGIAQHRVKVSIGAAVYPRRRPYAPTNC